MSGVRRLRIAIVCEFFAPGFRAGGPIRSLTNLCAALGRDFEFWVFTRNHDDGVADPYDEPSGEWLVREDYRVFYAADAQFPRSLNERLAEISPDLVYLNGWFSGSTVWALWSRVGRRFGVPILLAPRGEFRPGALALKHVKKRLYLAIAKRVRPYRGAAFHATSTAEADDIRREFGPETVVFTVPNLTTAGRRAALVPSAPKGPGELRMVFLARVSPVKNIEFLFSLLRRVGGALHLTVAGPFENAAYEAAIRASAAALSDVVHIEFTGAIPHDEVPATLAAHHCFVLPTHNENFGHAIVDAWSAGLPVVISDRTPWRALTPESGGWDVSLEDADRWVTVLQQLVATDDATLTRWRAGAASRAAGIVSSAPLESWRDMLVAAAGRTKDGRRTRK